MSGDYVEFFGKVFNRRDKPDDPRKVVSFDRYEGKRDDGTAKYVKATGIVYEDGVILELPKHLVMKEHPGPGAQIYDFYFSKHQTQKVNRDEFSDEVDDDLGF